MGRSTRRRGGRTAGARCGGPRSSAALLVLACAALALGASAKGHASRPGGAGHALLLRNNVLLKTDFKDFPTTALTFECWLSTSDFCNAGTILSYAKNSQATDPAQRIADFNSFVIFDPRNVLACHDFQYIDLRPDPHNESCHASYKNTTGFDSTAAVVERTGRWHHLAVTWSTADAGLTRIYVNGLLMASAYSQKTQPLEPGGALMIGGEQDCFAGCTDPTQGFNGLLDEVRIWRTVRSQEDILKHMRWVTGLENEPDLVAYWKFNDPDSDEGQFRLHTVAADSSTRGNHLSLLNPPHANQATLQPPGATLQAGALTFRNNFAINKETTGMPEESFTVEMWAKGGALYVEDEFDQTETLLSYATQKLDANGNPTAFLDDGLRIERLQKDLNIQLLEPFWATSTVGAIRVHINSNEHEDSTDNTAFVDFDAGWTDNMWHHVAVTWDSVSGLATCYFDGVAKTAFWRNDQGIAEQRPPSRGGVEANMAAGTRRNSKGSLVLGQDQDCFGGCFQASRSFHGDMAVVRIWSRALPLTEIKRNMAREHPQETQGLVAMYLFGATGLQPEDGGGTKAVDSSGAGHHLQLRSSTPLFEYSTAPLTMSDGRPVKPPTPGTGGYSLALHDKQVLLLTDFQDFPSTAITLEFWMYSVDGCRKGVPFSYATGAYKEQDNAFLLFNYNSFGVSVMEDEGHLGDHLSGVAATDGNWHHIAVTWESATGRVILYDNSRPVWRVYRSRGKSIPSGGTVVIGREQDCMGGCFDSADGAAGVIQKAWDREYGVQDFFGVIEEMRVWKVARTAEEIRKGMDADNGRGPGGFSSPGLDPKHPDLVAYWKFDEGQGYLVKDATGRGHDLTITQPEPQWLVTRWLSTCGNGVGEGEEECDDGDLVGGNGCSPLCRVEKGYTCTGNPSVCTKKGSTPPPPVTPPPSADTDGGPAPAPAQPAGDTPLPGPDSAPAGGGGGGGSDGGGSKRGGGHVGLVVGLVLAAVTVLLAGITIVLSPSVRRSLVSGVEEATERIGDAVGHVTGRGSGRGNQLLRANIDPEMHGLLAPDFLQSSPAASPGHPGPYSRLPGQLNLFPGHQPPSAPVE